MEAESGRTKFRRKPKRGSHDRSVIDAILDEAIVAHLGILDGEHPVVIPTLHARVEDLVYIHGSAASRTLDAVAGGAEVCLTVSLVDGLVLAKAAFRHSVNYRSVVLFGRGRAIEDEGEKLVALRAFVEQLMPGRWADVRPPSPRELRATKVLALPIEEASAKVRTGPPNEGPEDAETDCWSGVLPLHLEALSPLAAGQTSPPPVPNYVAHYRGNDGPTT
jgi:uncharacterized protein